MWGDWYLFSNHKTPLIRGSMLSVSFKSSAKDGISELMLYSCDLRGNLWKGEFSSQNWSNLIKFVLKRKEYLCHKVDPKIGVISENYTFPSKSDLRAVKLERKLNFFPPALVRFTALPNARTTAWDIWTNHLNERLAAYFYVIFIKVIQFAP